MELGSQTALARRIDPLRARVSLQGMKSVFLAVLFSVVSLSATQAQVPIPIFLTIDGIEGDSTDSEHANSIPILSFSSDVFQQGLNLAGGGGSAAKTQFNPIVVIKRFDKTSPQLFLACATGKHIKSATIAVQKAGNQPYDFFKIVLSDVLISSVSASADSEQLVDTEKVTLSFSKISWQFRPQDPNGSPLPPVVGSFDLKANKPF